MADSIEAEKASAAIAPVGKPKTGFFRWISKWFFRLIIFGGILFIILQFVEFK